ncbi:hypothetical protein BKA03_002872 [Demequina lutea]|uniref:Uncharacterized protein n=1 Tax=Demequina lutea TaxID=431489 RepID=A0A7Y9ZDV4_9MICO|nr:hypothetical protein [Demequina lutea]
MSGTISTNGTAPPAPGAPLEAHSPTWGASK